MSFLTAGEERLRMRGEDQGPEEVLAGLVVVEEEVFETFEVFAGFLVDFLGAMVILDLNRSVSGRQEGLRGSRQAIRLERVRY